MSQIELNPPAERECLRCGRQDVWDDSNCNWIIRREDGEKLAGNPFCVHEWDINGTHNPITR